MRALVIEENTLVLRERELPPGSDSSVVVKVAASALNAADLRQIEGRYPSPPGWPEDVPGLEVAGIVRSAGSEVTGLRIGDRVMALIGGGGHAEYVAIPANLLTRVPESISLVEAAAFPEAFCTAWDALIDQAALRVGERVLVTGAAGGVGTAAVQVAAAAGAVVIASIRTDAAREAFTEQIALPGVTAIHPEQEREFGPYDIVLDLVSGPSAFDRITWTAPHGRVLFVGSFEPAPAQAPDWIGHAMLNRVRVQGTTIRPRSNEEKALMFSAVAASLLPLVEDGRIRLLIDRVVEMERHQEAFARLAGRGKIGKIVLAME